MLLASGATMRNFTRRSELYCGYCLPAWFEGQGFQSSAGELVSAMHHWPNKREVSARNESVIFIGVLVVRCVSFSHGTGAAQIDNQFAHEHLFKHCSRPGERIRSATRAATRSVRGRSGHDRIRVGASRRAATSAWSWTFIGQTIGHHDD